MASVTAALGREGAGQCKDSAGRGGPPGDDTGHAVLTVAGAVDAQPGQEVEQVG